MRDKQRNRMRTAPGFIAALDQSGGSTPGALAGYGVDASRFSDEAQMFDLVHQMRSRIMTSPSFDGDRIVGAILFEQTMDREVEGVATANYLWSQKNVVPFIKIDQGLAPESDGVRLMKANPELGGLLERAQANDIFGTKMRSVINTAVVAGIGAVVDQQFAVAHQVLETGLVPIIEPEISIDCPDKAEAEAILREQLHRHIEHLGEGQEVMFKLTIPDEPDFYADLISDRRVLRVVALSGGYSRVEANELLAQNRDMAASFSRAFVEGLSYGQSDVDFDATLDATITSIFRASST